MENKQTLDDGMHKSFLVASSQSQEKATPANDCTSFTTACILLNEPSSFKGNPCSINKVPS
jgi:hypothetical protein